MFFDSCGDRRNEDKFVGVFRSGMRTFTDALPGCRDMKPRQRATRARAAGKSLAELWNSLRERCRLRHLPAMEEPGGGGDGRTHKIFAVPTHPPPATPAATATLLPVAGADRPPDATDNRTWTLRLIADRRGQTAFRDALFGRFGGKCVVTDCNLADVLEAAHIKPYAGEPGDQEPDNGLLLRADLHTLFDLHLMSVQPDTLAVVWHPRLTASPH